ERGWRRRSGSCGERPTAARTRSSWRTGWRRSPTISASATPPGTPATTPKPSPPATTRTPRASPTVGSSSCWRRRGGLRSIMPDTRRFGVIGAGGFAEVCHVPGLQSHPAARVVALCGRRLDHARAMADRLGVPDVHTDYRELLARDDIDAVTITTPNAAH